MDLFQAESTFLNERLAKHYGIPNVTGPGHIRNAIMFCQAFIKERGLRLEKIHDAAILAKHAAEKQTRFLFKGCTKTGIKLSIDIGIRLRLFEFVKLEPLRGEAINK